MGGGRSGEPKRRIPGQVCKLARAVGYSGERRKERKEESLPCTIMKVTVVTFMPLNFFELPVCHASNLVALYAIPFTIC